VPVTILTVTFEDRLRADSFGDDAAQYDRARPSYPSELFDDLLPDDKCNVVDVGCGTGIVARLLAKRGCSVIGIEPDGRMAQLAMGHGLTVEISTFEDWDSHGRTFDVLTAGQSWHWVNPTRGAEKAAAVLRPGGRFGVFWNGLRHDPVVTEGFDRIYSRLAPHLLDDSVALGTNRPSGDPDDRAFRTLNAFTGLEERAYSWQRAYPTNAWLDELPTHSGHRTLPARVLSSVLDEVGELIEGLGGRIVVDYTTSGLFGERR
jgi:SAM-dependent methyltransferase